MEDNNYDTASLIDDTGEISKFTESYASFNRIVNSLQRKYIELKDEFTAQNEKLVEANQKLVELTQRNLAATQFLNSILEAVPVGVISIDETGSVTSFNPAASVIMGIPRKEPLGKQYRAIIPRGEPNNASALRTYETGEEVDSVEKKMKLSDGSKLNLSVSTSILNDNQGRAMGAVEVLQDLTKMKKMEQEIARLNTLAALGEMAATIAHEVRNPLSGISGFAALLERDFEKDDPKREVAKKIIAGVSSLNETISTLLNYTRFEETNKKEVDYYSFLKTMLDQYLIDNSEKVENSNIELIVPEEKNPPVSLTLDPLLFRQVFFNLISNAIEAGSGKVEVLIGYRKLSRQAAVSRYAEKIMLGIDETVVETTIIDDGCGIEQENLKNVFSPFFTTRQGGTGLGLAVATKIMKAHGGEIIVYTKVGNGTTFTLLMPTKV